MHVAEPAVIEKVATEVGLDGARLIAEAQQPACKARLREQTDQAIAIGVFGVPTIAVGNELFWGYDDLAFVERFLDGTDVIGPDKREQWSALPQAAARKKTPLVP